MSCLVEEVKQRKLNSRAQGGADSICLVSFMNYDLGFFDEDVGRVEPALNPWLPEKV